MGTPGAAPARLGRYELLARLATGGMGEIFLARLEGAERFEKLIVVKRILPHLADDPRFRAMLIAEARIASMMTHANVCHVYELGETDGQLYIVMEYLEGVTLLPLLRKSSRAQTPLEFGFIAGVIQQTTDGLHYAHELRDRSGEELGIVHRDVTPTNVFLTNAGVVKVLDFGIAKVKDASAHTQTGAVKGKYAYMAPEQLRGAAIDRRADVFALGVVLYEMLALRRLFQRKTDYLTFRAVMEQPIVDVRHYRPDCPDAVADALARALDRDPSHRFDTARQFGTAVLDALTGTTRPWSQGELGDFVVRSFHDELQQRGALIASAVRASGQHPVPVIQGPDEEAADGADGGDDEGGGEFPPVESTVPAAAAVQRPSGASPSVELMRSGSHAIRGGLDAGSAERLRSGSVSTRGAAAAAQVVALPPAPPAPRSVVWPLVAFAMVAIAGGALYLVWRQMGAPPTVVITSGSSGQVVDSGSDTVVVGPAAQPPVAAPPIAPPPAAGSALDAGVEPAGSARPARGPAHRSPDLDQKVVMARQEGATRCVQEHGRPPAGTMVTIVVAPDGKPQTVTIAPQAVDATPLGACIRGVFKAATFPRGARERTVAVTLVAPA